MSGPEFLTAFQHREWATIPVEPIGDGIERQMIWGERLMVCRLRLQPGVITAVHSHLHEQITLVERGRVEFTIDGQSRLASAGDILHFPPDIQHGATMLDAEVILIDIFSPVREEFLPPVRDRSRIADGGRGPRDSPLARPLSWTGRPLILRVASHSCREPRSLVANSAGPLLRDPTSFTCARWRPGGVLPWSCTPSVGAQLLWRRIRADRAHTWAHTCAASDRTAQN